MPQLAIFQSGNVHFALDRDCIGRIEPITTALKAASQRIGKQTVAHKGHAMLLIDLAVGLGASTAGPHPRSSKMIVIKGRPAVALWADRIHGVATANPEDMDALPPVFAGTARACFPRVVRRPKGLALVVDTRALTDIESSGANEGQVRQDVRKDSQRPVSATLDAHPGKGQVMHADVAVENIVDMKLHQFIGRRVKQVITQTMTESLARHGVRL